MNNDNYKIKRIIMLKDKLIEIIQNSPSYPGSFREKDLIILFDECSDKFRTLVRLQEEVNNIFKIKK